MMCFLLEYFNRCLPSIGEQYQREWLFENTFFLTVWLKCVQKSLLGEKKQSLKGRGTRGRGHEFLSEENSSNPSPSSNYAYGAALWQSVHCSFTKTS
jgi:hypothetical protein